MTTHPLAWAASDPVTLLQPGVTSVCSAHPLVIEAAMLLAVADGRPLLLEATVNQVNHEGGYTGLTAQQFRDEALSLAARCGLAPRYLILGGDHLGPNPWRHLDAPAAMARAEETVRDYARAGFRKLHLDCSMGCRGEPEALPDALAAARAARLAAVAEAAAEGGDAAPRYVIGTEVPKPGGATEALQELELTRPQAALATYAAHGEAFAAAGAGSAFERVIALVVQPGVEFGHESVVAYDPPRARALSDALVQLPGLVFEAHSTDYQPPDRLAALVRDGFAILKVGPALTFALREALYALDHIRTVLDPAFAGRGLIEAMEGVMLADPSHWSSHYRGDTREQRVLRHYSYSDRIRYYWPTATAIGAVAQLLAAFETSPIPETLISQFLPQQYARVVSGESSDAPRDLVVQAVRDVLAVYAAACAGPALA